jgi:cell division septal protein FtsQ
MRERIAATQSKLPTPSMQNIQSTLSSRLERVYRQFNHPQAEQLPNTMAAKPNPRSPRRKPETRRSPSLYESTLSAETQRKTNVDAFTPKKGRRLFDARAEAAPPVMVRGGMGGMAFGRTASSRMKKQKNTRRRYDVPLKVQGAEVRLPSIPIIHLGWRALSLMVLMMTASLFLIWKAPVFQVTDVKAEGLKRLTVGDLNTVMGTVGSSVFTVDPNDLEEALTLAFPELSSIAVKVNLPASIKVVVTEREPVIAWLQDDNEAWVDGEGISFPPRGNPERTLVRVEGHGTPPGVTTETNTTITSQSLPAGMTGTVASPLPSLRLTPKLVSSILSLGGSMPADTVLVYDSEHGLGWNDPNGWEVYFGAEDQDLQMKLRVYETLVDHLQNEGIQPELISVEYVHAPYYRMER